MKRQIRACHSRVRPSRPANTNPSGPEPSVRASVINASAACVSGTRCVVPFFVFVPVDKMVQAEVAEAQRLAREWDAAHPREP